MEERWRVGLAKKCKEGLARAMSCASMSAKSLEPIGGMKMMLEAPASLKDISLSRALRRMAQKRG